MPMSYSLILPYFSLYRLALNNIFNDLALPNYYIIKTQNQIYLSNSEWLKEIYGEYKKASLQGYKAYDSVYLTVL
jgi:hypothetical protein